MIKSFITSLFLAFLLFNCISGSSLYSTVSNSIGSDLLEQGGNAEDSKMALANNESFRDYTHNSMILIQSFNPDTEGDLDLEMISNFDIESNESNINTVILQQERNTLISRIGNFFIMILGEIFMRFCGLVVFLGVFIFSCFIPIIFLIVFLCLRA